MPTKVEPNFIVLRGDKQPNPNVSVDKVVIENPRQISVDDMRRLVRYLRELTASDSQYLAHKVRIGESCPSRQSIRVDFGRHVTEVERVSVHNQLQKDISEWLNIFWRRG